MPAHSTQSESTPANQMERARWPWLATVTDRKNYIVNPFYDYFFFIFSPLLALLLGYLVAYSETANQEATLWGHQGSHASIFIGAFIFSHLFIVFFRSYGNKEVFKTYPVRFLVVPPLLFISMITSTWALVIIGVLATWWDVYHSSLQTFGLGRIYDMKKGNHQQVGRRLDYWLNLLVYMGPILAGATLMDHVNDFNEFQLVGSTFFTAVPAYVESRSSLLTLGIVAFGVPLIAVYCFKYWQYYRQGYQVSLQKMLLMISTAVTSVWAWGFNSFGEAFFIMNFFHALQYFAIVWAKEKGNLGKLFRLPTQRRWGRWLSLLLFVSCGAAYGIWAEVTAADSDTILAFLLMVSILHFWYDGFIWSVKKKQV